MKTNKITVQWVQDYVFYIIKGKPEINKTFVYKPAQEFGDQTQKNAICSVDHTTYQEMTNEIFSHLQAQFFEVFFSLLNPDVWL